MNNYKNSDYAVNKHAAGIVYRFANQTIEITLDAYLSENPTKSEHDFRELKAISDTLYHEQDRRDYRNTWKDISVPDTYEPPYRETQPSIETSFEDDKPQIAYEIIQRIKKSGELSETQSRRFICYFVDGLSLRRIADMEGVSHIAIRKSIQQSLKKIRIYFSGEG